MADLSGRRGRFTRTCITALMLSLLLVSAGCAGQRSAPLPQPNFAAPVIIATPTPLPREVAPQPPLIAPRAVTGRVAIDPGHGGKDPGAIAHGVQEKVVNLAIAKRVSEILSERGIHVMLTRNSDAFIELADRAGMSNRFNADLFVSIHADANPNPARTGHSILLPQSGDTRAALAARLVNARMVEQGSQSYTVRRDDRGLVVLRSTTAPAILVEAGFLTNAGDAARLSDPAYRGRVAAGIAQGIVDYLAQMAR